MEEQELKLYIYLMKQDDPKKCTSNRLQRLKLVKPIFNRMRIPRKAVVLNPFARDVFFFRKSEEHRAKWTINN